jgi:23S rRNA pseudouridine2605 synthase
MRLAKFLAHAGVASRRAAEEIIRAGRVTVGGERVVDPARDVDDSSGVAVDGTPLRPARDRLVYALHKPAGVVSTAKDTHGRPTVVELVPPGAGRLYPVGRLDADSTGLILLTNDGELAHQLTHPKFGVPKTYRAKVGHAPVREEELQRLREGVELEDGRTSPARIRLLGSDLIELTITEGRKRQVRRMCDAIGHPVRELRRISFGPLALGDLAPGAARRLKASEVEELRAHASSRPKPPGSKRTRPGSPSRARGRR